MKARNCLLPLLLAAASAAAQPGLPSPVRVVMDNNYPPFVFTDSKGTLQGILVDEWRLWEARTGIKTELTAMDWGEALRRMKAGEFDVIDTIFKTPERTADFDFTKPYARLDVPIFFQKDISGITDLKSLKEFPVAAKAGDAAVDLLKQNGITTLMLYNSYEAMIEAARQHRVNVFVMDAPPALYFLHKQDIQDRFRQSAPVNVGEFHRAVKKGNAALLKTVEEGFAAVGPAELKQVEEKWYGKAIRGYPYLRYMGYAGVAGLAVITGLAVWTVVLNRLVNRRTAALQTSEARLRALLDHTPDWVWLKDTSSRYITANAPYAQAVGCSPETLAGRSDAELWPEREARQFVADDQAVIQTGQARRLTERVTDTRGNVRWFETSKAPVRRSDGATMGIVGIARDITKRKQTEEALLESEQRFRSTFESAPFGIFQSTVEGRLLRVNETGVRLFGYSSAEEFLAAATNIAQQLFVSREQRQEVLHEALGCDTYVRREVKYRRKDGSEFLAVLSMRAVREASGEANFVEGFVEDITARKQAEVALQQSEAQYRMLFESAHDAIFMMQGNRFIRCNPATLLLFGCREKDIIEETPARFSPAAQPDGIDSNTKAQAKIDAALAGVCPPFEWRHRKLDGTEFEAEVSLNRIELNGELFLQAIVRDITERKRAEEERRQLSARILEAQDQERRHLARELHDTTAQHLAALTLNLANLKGKLAGIGEPAYTRFCDCIELAHQAAQEIRTRSYLLHPPLLEVMGLAGAVEDYAQGFSARTGIAVELQAPADFGRLPDDVELALFRVVQESLANVLKHSQSRSARIRFTRDRAFATLEVRDMGQGIPAEILDRIRNTGSSTGVGLAGMRERLHKLRGRLELESGPGGTTIRAVVPLEARPPDTTMKT